MSYKEEELHTEDTLIYGEVALVEKVTIIYKYTWSILDSVEINTLRSSKDSVEKFK